MDDLAIKVLFESTTCLTNKSKKYKNIPKENTFYYNKNSKFLFLYVSNFACGRDLDWL